MTEGMYKYKEVLDTVTKDILSRYLKGEKSLDELVDEAVANFKDALLQAVNGFDKKGESEKKADLPSGEFAWCPVDPTKIKVRLFRNICQDWQEIPQCFHGLCGFFPVFDKTPVTNVKLKPKEEGVQTQSKSSSVEEDVSKMLEELEKKGVGSMAERFRILRNSFLEKLGVEKLREIIRNTLKRGSEMERIVKMEDYNDSDVWKVELYELIKSGSVKRAKCKRVIKGSEEYVVGKVAGVEEFDDGSYVVVIEDGGKRKIVLPEQVLEAEK